MKKKQIKEIDGVLTLCAGDIVCQCPLTAPWMIPGKLQGTATFTARACSEVCPLWRLNPDIEWDEEKQVPKLDSNGQFIVKSHTLKLCHGSHYEIPIETNEKQPNTSIIGLSN